MRQNDAGGRGWRWARGTLSIENGDSVTGFQAAARLVWSDQDAIRQESGGAGWYQQKGAENAPLAATLLMANGAEAGEGFLAENLHKPGVVVLPSGLQYKVLAEGPGMEHAKEDTPCQCHYAGTHALVF